MKDEHPTPPVDDSKDASIHPQPVAAKRPLMLVLNQRKKKKRATNKSSDGHDTTSRTSRTSSVAQEFGADPTTNRDADYAAATSTAQRTNEPLVIPALHNTFQRGTVAVVASSSSSPAIIQSEDPAGVGPAASDEVIHDSNGDEDTAAVRALQEQADAATTTATTSGTSNLVVPPVTTSQHRTSARTTGNNNPQEVSETQHYHAELQRLPEALSETAEAYERVPIAEFGAALLRGMGWQGNNDTKNDDDRTLLPRPQRLGLGAIPVALMPPDHDDLNNGRRRPRGPEQYQRQQAQREQQLEYQNEHAARVATDRQQTLQNGSIVLLHPQHGRPCCRARIHQLVGVPGLNRVAVVLEGGVSATNNDNGDAYKNDQAVTIISRQDIDRLLTRSELEERPFREHHPNNEDLSPQRRRDDSRRSVVERNDRSKPSGRKEKSDSRKKSNKNEKETRSASPTSHHSSKQCTSNDDNRRPQSSASRTWLIPHIRVRVVTEKLGRRYYKKKGVVVDVTPLGATLQMDGAASTGASSAATVVLDRVPERYLETALPKVGGRVVVLAGPQHQHIRGRLLERNSRQGVLQDDETLEIHTVALDDMAEWCGPS